jgi:hypothetical protein
VRVQKLGPHGELPRGWGWDSAISSASGDGRACGCHTSTEFDENKIGQDHKLTHKRLFENLA